MKWLTGIDWRFLVLVLLLAVIGVQQVRIERDAANFAELEAAAQRQLAAAVQRARTTEQNILAAGEAQRKADAHQIAALDADRARLERMLRDRPARPRTGGVPAAAAPAGGSGAGAGAAAAAGATGADLYAQDGAFLIGEAARADRQRVQLESCLRQYESAREALNNQGAR